MDETTVDDDDVVHCERHGPSRVAFVCQHLLHGSGLGFWYCHYETDWQAWCGDCDDLMMQTGYWTEEAEAVAGIRVVCRRCYANIRRRNRDRRG
ncbi:MAG: hypothetical protein ACRC7O_16795 [Fimbriiglobus sp.]